RVRVGPGAYAADRGADRVGYGDGERRARELRISRDALGRREAERPRADAQRRGAARSLRGAARELRSAAARTAGDLVVPLQREDAEVREAHPERALRAQPRREGGRVDLREGPVKVR